VGLFIVSTDIALTLQGDRYLIALSNDPSLVTNVIIL